MVQPVVVIDASPRIRDYGTRPRSRRAGTRRWPRRLGWGLVLLVVVWGAYTGRSVWKAIQELRAGRRLIDSAKVMTSPTELAGAAPAPLLQRAAGDFTSASGRLDSKLLIPLRLAPVLGRQLQSARHLSRSAGAASSAVATALTTMHDATAHAPSASGRVALLHQLVSVATAARDRIASVDLGPRAGLLSTLASARNDLSGQLLRTLTGLNRTVAVANAGIDLFQGNHQVLMLLVNNAEMRAGSGMANQVGLLSISDGHVSLGQVQSVYDVPVPPGAVPATGDFGARWGWLGPTTDWQELLASPRFDQTAALAAKMWGATGHAPVDGVIAVDPFAMQTLLDATGPVEAVGQPVSSANVLSELFHDQYVRNPTATAQRHDELGDLAQAAITKLDAGGWSASKFGLGLADVARGRHVLVWVPNQADETQWQAAGVAGAATPNSLLLSLLNRSRDKADPFMATGAAISVRAGPATTQVDVTVVVTNRVPMGEPAIVAGPDPAVQAEVGPQPTIAYGDYVGILAISVPGAAKNVTLDDGRNYAAFGPDGPTFVAAKQVIVPRGATQVFHLTFELPGASGALLIQPSSRTPGVAWRYGAASLPDGTAHVISW